MHKQDILIIIILLSSFAIVVIASIFLPGLQNSLAPSGIRSGAVAGCIGCSPNGMYLVKDSYLWKFTSPQGMVENPGYDSYVKDGLTFKIFGWKYSASVADSSNTLTITPMKNGSPPVDVSRGQQIGLAWILTPMSDLFQSPIRWSSGADPGLTVYNLLETGLLDVYFSNVSSGVSFQLSSSSQPSKITDSIYQVGSIRIRVISGTVSQSGNALTISASSGTIQFVVYARNVFDDAQIDELGAIKSPTPNEVVESSGFTQEKSERIKITKMNLDKYIAINPSTPASKGLLVQNSVMYVTDSSGNINSNWGFGTYTVSYTKSGVLSIRNMNYFFGGIFSTQTFNFYLSTSRGTQTFWSIGRITQPYSVYYYPQTDVHVFSFPETQDDGAQDGFMTNAITTNVVLAFQDSTKTLITAENFKANVNLQQTGEAGNSIDPGWRHVLTTPAGDIKAILVRSGSWSTRSNPSGGYTYASGNAAFNVGGSSRYFTMKRLWQGYWQNSPDVIASYVNVQANNNIVGFMKSVGSVTPAGSTITVNHVTKLDSTGAIPSSSEAEATYQKYSIPSGVPTINGMIDLSSPNALTNADWDIGNVNGEPIIFYMSSTPPTTTTTTTTTITSTTAATTTTTTPISQKYFNVSNFACSSATNVLNCNVTYSNFLDGNVTILLYISGSDGTTLDTAALNVTSGIGTAQFYHFCSINTTSYVSWEAYMTSDSRLTNPIAFSDPSQVKIVSC